MRGRVFALMALAVLEIAAEEKSAASGFKAVLRSSSDAVVYVDTTQRDRGGDRELDRRIKEKFGGPQAGGADEGASEDPFAKPFLLGANVDLTSRNPLKFMADGRLKCADVAAITNYVSALDRIGASSGGSRLSLALGEVKNGACPFDLLYGLPKRVPRAGAGEDLEFAHALASMKAGDPLLFVVFRGRRFAPLAKTKDLMRFLFTAEVVAFSCSIDGKLVRFGARIAFVDEETATESETSVATLINQYAGGALDGAFRDFNVKREGTVVSCSFVADNAKFWGLDEVRKDNGQKPAAQ